MLITNHVLQGAIVGATAPGPASAFLLGLASHFTADSLPHWGGPPIREAMHVAVPDGLVGLSAMAWVARTTPPGHRVRVLAGMAGACLPDADKPCDIFLGGSPFPPAVDRFHQHVQREAPHRMPYEILAAGATALVVRRLLKRLA